VSCCPERVQAGADGLVRVVGPEGCGLDCAGVASSLARGRLARGRLARGQLACLGGGARLPGGRTRQNAACSGDAPVGEWLAAPSVATLGMSAVPVLTVGGGGFL